MMPTVYQQALDHFGATNQIGQTIGEMAELTDKLIKRTLQGRGDDAGICEEIADVEIMLAQLRLIFDPTSTVVCDWKLRKIERLLGRIKGETA